MENTEKKDNRIIPFLIGLFIGWKGVKVLTHIVYWLIILTLFVMFILKR